MKREIIVVNDFYQDPERIVHYAMGLEYCSPYAHNQRGSSSPDEMMKAPWLTSRFKKALDCPFKSSTELLSKLEKIIGEEIDLEHWNRDFPELPDGSVSIPRPDLIDPTQPDTFENLLPNATSCRWNCAFNIKLHDQPMGTGVHNHMKDRWNSVGPDGWTGLIYLNKEAPRATGLKLFKNTFGNDLEWMSDPDRWELMDEFANVYNRLILVRGWMPHAGGSGFGTSIETGRLFQTLFFKTKKVQEIAGCSIEV